MTVGNISNEHAEFVDPEPISHIYDSFFNLGDDQRFVADSTRLDVDETAENVLARMPDSQQVLNG